jgi:Divergent InlB B-repeat domain/Putative Ig domain
MSNLNMMAVRKSLLPMSVALCAVFALIYPCAARASIAYGSINNFDTVNDTGHECHGFEIELDDCHSTDITYTYNYNHYGVPEITEDNSVAGHPKVFIKWQSKKNADGSWAAYTAIPAGPISPTNGHMFTNPAVNFGGEHFGVGYKVQPSAVLYNWLIDNGSGALVHGGAVQVSTPTFTYFPPVAGAAAQVQAVIAPPPPPVPPVKEFGKAVWVKEIKTTTHNANKVKLRDLVSDDPDDPNDKNWKNGEPDEVEVEWRILQKKTSAADGGVNNNVPAAPEALPNGDEVVTRRYEFYKYAGPLDAETGEAMGDLVGPDGSHGSGTVTYADHFNAAIGEWVTITTDMATQVVVGDFTGSQMAAVDVNEPIGLIDHVGEGRVNRVFAPRAVVIEGALPFVATQTGSIPPGMTFDEVTGILAGTPTSAGTYNFQVTASDGVNPDVAKNYTMTIAAVGAALPARSLLDTTVSPVGAGTTSGDGAFDPGTSAMATATPSPGYGFLNWTDNGQIVSTDPGYTLVMDVNHSLVANFTVSSGGGGNSTITTSSLPSAGGTTSGGGTLANNASVTVAAVPNAGYTFVSWTESGTLVSASASYTFTATANRTLVANFASSGGGTQRTITTSSSPVQGGTTSGAGSYGDGTSVTVVATPSAGYAFSKWKENGTAVSSSPGYTFTVGANRTLVATFGLAITASVSPAGAGTVEMDSSSYPVGDPAQARVKTTSAGYTFVNWTENGNVVSTLPTYAFTVTVSRTLVANFVSAGNVSISLTASPTAGGVVTGGGVRAIGAPVTVLASQASGYKFTHWSEDGVSVSTKEDYKFTAGVNRALVANFLAIPASGIHETENPDELEFEWPEVNDGWVLQESTDMVTWVNSTREVIISGGMRRARISTLDVPGVFFRLVKP